MGRARASLDESCTGHRHCAWGAGARSSPPLPSAPAGTQNYFSFLAEGDKYHAARGCVHFLSAFFNTLTVDLDGCELSFRALRLQPAGAAGARGGAVAAAGGELELQLELGVCVRRFPSPFVKF